MGAKRCSLTPFWLGPCRHDKCPCNHLRLFKDRHGFHAEMILVHFKDDTMKGIQRLPLAWELLEPIVMLQQGRAQVFPNSSALFPTTRGELYKQDYFSTVVAGYLSLPTQRVTYRLFRHLFPTLWRSFIHRPSTKLHDMTVRHLEAAAASLMLTSSDMLGTVYDDSTLHRATNVVLALWPEFVKFVEQDYKDHCSQECVLAGWLGT